MSIFLIKCNYNAWSHPFKNPKQYEIHVVMLWCFKTSMRLDVEILFEATRWPTFFCFPNSPVLWFLHQSSFHSWTFSCHCCICQVVGRGRIEGGMTRNTKNLMPCLEMVFTWHTDFESVGAQNLNKLNKNMQINVKRMRTDLNRLKKTNLLKQNVTSVLYRFTQASCVAV